MNSEIIKPSRCLILGAFMLMPWIVGEQVMAADNLLFHGVLVAEPCTLRPGDDAIPLDMSRISSQYLYANSRSIGTSFSIHLEGCDTSIADSVTTTFTGLENSQLPGLLALDGSSVARGIALGIETVANIPLPLNTISDEQALIDGNNTIEFKAYVRGEPLALANRTIRAGSFKAISIFTLAYP